ncbi:hypothetical protein PpBr36_02737, partial [Pyricularia pennisetigena]|uniref:hypothetical protein n=1 Tax=Pyricularia pennisetigena TaxID=1578925 RepID=UPI00114FAB53
FIKIAIMRYSLIFIFIHTALAAPKTRGTNQKSEVLRTTTPTDGILVTKDINPNNTNSNITKRGYVTSTCNDKQEAKLKKAMRLCKTFADAAYRAVYNNEELRRKYFKTDSAENIYAIGDVYKEISKACDLEINNIPFGCEEEKGHCETSSAYTRSDEDKVYLCPDFFTYHDSSRARSLIHELSHLNY